MNLLCLFRWQRGWTKRWARWPPSWNTVLRLSLSYKENVWCPCTAVHSTHVHSWRMASIGGGLKYFNTGIIIYLFTLRREENQLWRNRLNNFNCFKFTRDKTSDWCNCQHKYIKMWEYKTDRLYKSLLVLSAGVLCLLVNGRRCLRRPEQRTKSQSLVLACPPSPTSP